jgi:hypothetical protein
MNCLLGAVMCPLVSVGLQSTIRAAVVVLVLVVEL